MSLDTVVKELEELYRFEYLQHEVKSSIDDRSEEDKEFLETDLLPP